MHVKVQRVLKCASRRAEFSEKLRKQVKHRRGGAGAPPGPTGTIDIGTTSIDASPGGNASGSADAGGSNGVGKASEEIAASAGSQGRGGLGKGLGKVSTVHSVHLGTIFLFVFLSFDSVHVGTGDYTRPSG